jgi:methylaspartate ammonia-lyase
MLHLRPHRLGSIHQTVEAIVACKQKGLGVLLGGSYADTERSQQVMSQVALAAQPDLLWVKPGPDAEASIAQVYNEMARTLAWIAAQEMK